MKQDTIDGLYGHPPDGVLPTHGAATQLSPMIPGAARLEDVREGSLSSLAILAPPGTLERRFVLALGLKALAPGSTLSVAAPKTKGGARLAAELRGFGCELDVSSRRHHRICIAGRPACLRGIDEAIAAGAPRLVEDLGVWSQPGIFSWDRLDPGSMLLVDQLPALSGRGADLGCGIGALTRAALASPKVEALTGIDIDRRAIDAARRNIDDPRLDLRWLDLRAGPSGMAGLDFVVMNPPFHGKDGAEDHDLGRLFIRRAADALRKGGVLWLVANRHLPYEATLEPLFRHRRPVAERAGFKIVEARR